MLIISGTIDAGGLSRDEVAAITTPMAQATRLENGCIAYAFYEDLEEPGQFLIYEEWETEAALTAHMQTPHMAEFRAKLAKLDGLSIKVQRFDTDGPKALG